MKKVFPMTLLFIFALLLAPVMSAEHHASGVSPDEALKRLQEGNERFAKEKAERPRGKLGAVRETSEHGQHPFATILACSDSRVPLPVIFDQGVGDIFSVNVAGNVSGKSQLGSIEYGVLHAGTRLFIVLGHTKCGAVTAACTDGGHEGNIASLVKSVAPAVKRVETKTGKNGEGIVADVCRENVFLQIESILKDSELLREAAEKGKLEIVGGIYDIDTGKVEFFGEHPKTSDLLKTPEKKIKKRNTEGI